MSLSNRNPLAKITRFSQLKPVYLIAGDEPFLVQDAIDQLKLIFFENNSEPNDWQTYDSENSAHLTNFEEILSPGFFFQKRALHLKLSYTDFKNHQKLLASYWENPQTSQLIVIELTNYDKRSRNPANLSFVSKVLKPQKSFIQATPLFVDPPPWKQNPQPWDSELYQWAKEQAQRKFGLKLSTQNLLTLIGSCGNNPSQIDTILEKIHLYAAPSKEISEDKLNCLVENPHSISLENFTQAIRNLDIPEIFKNLHNIENLGLYHKGRMSIRTEELIPILLKTLENTTRNLLICHQNSSRGELIKKLGLEKIRSQDLLAKALESWQGSARRFRVATLFQWQKKIFEIQRISRQGHASNHLIFWLVTQMFQRRLVPQA